MYFCGRISLGSYPRSVELSHQVVFPFKFLQWLCLLNILTSGSLFAHILLAFSALCFVRNRLSQEITQPLKLIFSCLFLMAKDIENIFKVCIGHLFSGLDQLFCLLSHQLLIEDLLPGVKILQFCLQFRCCPDILCKVDNDFLKVCVLSLLW